MTSNIELTLEEKANTRLRNFDKLSKSVDLSNPADGYAFRAALKKAKGAVWLERTNLSFKHKLVKKTLDSM